MLDLAYTTDAKITASALAFHAQCSIDEATEVLDDLAARDRVSIEVDDDGLLHYELPGRTRLALVPSPPFAPALVHLQHEPRQASPLLAAALSLFVPGAGHLYARHVVAAIAWFFVVGAAYTLILPGLLLHALSIGSAAAAARR